MHHSLTTGSTTARTVAMDRGRPNGRSDLAARGQVVPAGTNAATPAP